MQFLNRVLELVPNKAIHCNCLMYLKYFFLALFFSILKVYCLLNAAWVGCADLVVLPQGLVVWSQSGLESFERSAWLEVQDDAFRSSYGPPASLLCFLFSFWLLKKSGYLSYSFLLYLFCHLLRPHVLWHTLPFCVSCKSVVGGGGLIRFLWGQGQLFGSCCKAHGIWLSPMLWVSINDQCLNPLIHWELQNGEILILPFIFK